MSRRQPPSSVGQSWGLGVLLLGVLVVAAALPCRARFTGEPRPSAWDAVRGLVETGALDAQGAITLLPFMLLTGAVVVFFVLPR